MTKVWSDDFSSVAVNNIRWYALSDSDKSLIKRTQITTHLYVFLHLYPLVCYVSNFEFCECVKKNLCEVVRVKAEDKKQQAQYKFEHSNNLQQVYSLPHEDS